MGVGPDTVEDIAEVGEAVVLESVAAGDQACADRR